MSRTILQLMRPLHKTSEKLNDQLLQILLVSRTKKPRTQPTLLLPPSGPTPLGHHCFWVVACAVCAALDSAVWFDGRRRLWGRLHIQAGLTLSGKSTLLERDKSFCCLCCFCCCCCCFHVCCCVAAVWYYLSCCLYNLLLLVGVVCAFPVVVVVVVAFFVFACTVLLFLLFVLLLGRRLLKPTLVTFDLPKCQEQFYN